MHLSTTNNQTQVIFYLLRKRKNLEEVTIYIIIFSTLENHIFNNKYKGFKQKNVSF